MNCEWIRLGEFTPRDGEEVVVLTDDGNVEVALYEDGIWTAVDCVMLGGVTHFLRLPPKPVVVGEDREI